MITTEQNLEKPRLRMMMKTLNPARKARRIFLLSLLAGCLFSMSARAQGVAPAPVQPSSGELRDGHHDFDFNIGTWKIHTKLLLHPLTGSNDWVELNGTVHVRKVWNGRAQLEEIEAEGPTGHFEGLTLFLYNPQAHKWGQYFVDSASGVLNQPQIGEFKDGRGELFGQQSFNGRLSLFDSYGRTLLQNPTTLNNRFPMTAARPGNRILSQH